MKMLISCIFHVNVAGSPLSRRFVKITSLNERRPLTFVLVYDTIQINLAPVQDIIRSRRLVERERFPRVEVRHLRSRAVPGIMLAGTKTGPWGAFTGLGQETTGNARGNRVPGSLAWS